MCDEKMKIDVPFKPYYQDERVTLYNADCRKVLPFLPKHDLLLTDPPYGIGERMQGGTWGAAKKYDDFRTWDIAPDSKELLKIVSMCSHAIIWGGNYFTLPPSRGFMAWSKTNAVKTMSDIEYAWTSFDRPAKAWRGAVGKHYSGHPTEKPIGLIQWCFSQIGNIDTVLDPFSGSGTTGVAAKISGYKSTLIEAEEKYCEIAANRLRQGVLF